MDLTNTICSGIVVVLCGDENIIRKFMLAAYDNDMTSGDYVYIALTLLPSERVLTPWIRHDDRDEDAMKAYQPLLEVLFVYTSKNSSKVHVTRDSSGPATLAISVGLEQ